MDTTFNPGDHIVLTAGNGTVRHGRIIEWFEPTETWFVEIYPDRKLPQGDGFRTWFKPEQLAPIDKPKRKVDTCLCGVGLWRDDEGRLRHFGTGGRNCYMRAGTAEAAPTSNTEPAMTRDELAAWLSLRGVREQDIPQMCDEYAGRTEAEMDEAYEDTHGWMA